MKLLTATFILFLFCASVVAQNPLVKQWDYRFGGTNNDVINISQKTYDGGYILGGTSYSGVGGDKTQSSWDTFPAPGSRGDYWIVKIDSLGNKEWDKRFGGVGADRLFVVRQTVDKGYILGGWSGGSISGDRTQAGFGSFDYWIVKTDSLGNKEWDKDFGGANTDLLYDLQQTTDGGFIFGGGSLSGISGNKTEPLYGSSGAGDYWIVKTDSLGNKEWDKDFGGTDAEILTAIEQTIDGGYILGGGSLSGIGGIKTQPANGDWDYWLVKIDSTGTKQWDKSFGASNWDFLKRLKQSNDGGYILAGDSYSNIGGNKTSPNWDTTGITSDYWLVKTDANGNKQWDKSYGGTSVEEFFSSIILTNDGGYLCGGTSYSGIDGNKTEPNLGVGQTWIFKIDTSGNVQWDKTMHTNCGNQADYWGLLTQSTDGCYTIANTTVAGVGGDKTQSNRDTVCLPNCTSDFWIIKFCDTTTTSINALDKKNSLLAVSPNPFSNTVTLSFQNQNIESLTISVKNLLGQTLLVANQNSSTGNFIKTIDLHFLSNGIYILTATLNGLSSTQKIVKK